MADGFEIVSYKREAGRKTNIRFLNREVSRILQNPTGSFKKCGQRIWSSGYFCEG